MTKSNVRLIISILLPLTVGGLSALLTRGNMNLYQSIEKPPFAPPSLVFPIAWTILYFMMGLSSFLLLEKEKSVRIIARAYTWYILQLAMNFLWSIFFFNLKLYFFSFIWLIAMFITIVVCTKYFFQSSKLAGWLMVPYNVWMAFAAYLNLAIVLMNKS